MALQTLYSRFRGPFRRAPWRTKIIASKIGNMKSLGHALPDEDGLGETVAEGGVIGVGLGRARGRVVVGAVVHGMGGGVDHEFGAIVRPAEEGYTNVRRGRRIEHGETGSQALGFLSGRSRPPLERRASRGRACEGGRGW